MTDATEMDEAAIRETWLRQCGPCDAGLPMACVCSDADPRPVIERLLTALDEARVECDKAQRAAKTLGGIVEQNARMILDITGLHGWIDEDGDGDWGAVWENAYELLPRIKTAEAQVERLHFDLDREARARQAAEGAVAAVRALADRWAAEADERGDDDLLYTRGVANMLDAALATPTTPEEPS